MQLLEGELVVSPTDLTKSLACDHLIRLDLEVARGERPKPPQGGEELEILFRRGLEHETAYKQSLLDRGLEVVEVALEGQGRGALQAAEAETVRLMEAGADVVYQGTFFDGQWRGHADFLVKRSDRPGRWGWSYDVADTKLARRLKVPALLQMAAYAERLAVLQEISPERLTVVTGDGVERHYAFDQCASYARRVRAQLLQKVTAIGDTRPEPVEHCGQCRWQPGCRQQWRDEDHLSLVAFMRRDHQRALEEAGIGTVRGLGERAWDQLPATIGEPSRRRLAQQARLQLVERDTEQPVYELLEPEVGRGLALLPTPSPGDVFFDIEGDPFVGEHGLEYLWGIVQHGTFTPYWATRPEQEKATFEALVDRAMAAWAADPAMHIYHYAPYEPSRLTSLAARYATREAEVDQLLRGERLIDLYAVVRQCLRVSKESYSIKKLEAFYWRDREEGVADALGSVVAFERWLVEQDDALLEDIRRYNEDDCRSTQALRDWLEELRVEGGGDAVYARPEHSDGQPSDGQQQLIDEVAQLQADLLEGVPDLDRDDEQQGRWLLAGLLDWHRRESLPEWWEYYDRLEQTDEELVQDAAALGLLSSFEHSGTVDRSNLWRATFPPQETKLGPGETKYLDPRTQKPVGTIVEISPEEGWLVVRRGKRMPAPDAPSLVPGKPLDDREQRSRLRDLARDVLQQSVASERAEGRAARDLLLRRPPRVAGGLEGPAGDSATSAVARCAVGLDAGLLPVQGPPGTGKTYAGAQMVLRLVADGKRVGICGFSHKVISNLLDEVCKVARETGQPVRAMQKADDSDRCSSGEVTCTGDAKDIEAALAANEVDVVAGTAWLFARAAMQGHLDVLVVDEAGQMSLANVLAVAGAARSMVLLGDPQQLAQPVKGTHPEGADASALEHLLAGEATIPPGRGILLDTTFRMHPDVADFVSRLSYDALLAGAESCHNQRLVSPTFLGGTGLRYLPVVHEHNSAASDEEADAVARVVREVLRDGRWVDGTGCERELRASDILVLAPFNAHVHRLRHRLGNLVDAGVRVGTVDKFQGQEAPLVIYSLASSTAEDAPRDLGFLYSLNRFNVAISRARGVIALVCSPELLTPIVKKPENLRLVNALCRFVEEAVEVSAAPPAEGAVS
jgi:predicted RecB family nuclease